MPACTSVLRILGNLCIVFGSVGIPGSIIITVLQQTDDDRYGLGLSLVISAWSITVSLLTMGANFINIASSLERIRRLVPDAEATRRASLVRIRALQVPSSPVAAGLRVAPIQIVNGFEDPKRPDEPV